MSGGSPALSRVLGPVLETDLREGISAQAMPESEELQAPTEGARPGWRAGRRPASCRALEASVRAGGESAVVRGTA